MDTRRRKLSKADQIYEGLKAAIVSGELGPGTLVDKAVLAKRFDASRQPIAAALDKLAYDGLIDIVPQHGSFVSRMNSQLLTDWFFVRKAMEAEFAARFAEAKAPEALADLDRNLRYQEVALEAGDIEGFYGLDVEFHRIISDRGESREAARLLDRAHANLGRVRRLLLPEPGRAAQTLAEHRGIRDRLAEGDPALAGQAMRAHIDQVESRLHSFITHHPQYFQE
jgi:GntR family transcriptional regulator, rspAB operon transcriptional repressor